MTREYKGRRALILGGSCALAIGLAKTMIAEKVHPVLTHRNQQGRICIDESLHDQSGNYSSLALDLDKARNLASLDPVLAMGTDYLVDFAQGDFEGLVASADLAAVASFVQTNITHRGEVIRQVARSMVTRRRGRMVYISSTAAGRPNPGQGFYAAAKLASEALYRNLGLEMASRGITTVTLRPGYVDAGRGHRYLEKNAQVALAKVPLGRALETKEVVDTIMFLLSDSAVGFNATTLTMDGGLSSGK